MKTKLQINSKSETPIFQQIVDGMESQILTGKLEAGEFLPSVRDFAILHSINPNTVARAYQILQIQGLVEAIRGTGLKVKNVKSSYVEKRRSELLRLKIDELLILSQSLNVPVNELVSLIKTLEAEKKHE